MFMWVGIYVYYLHSKLQVTNFFDSSIFLRI